LFFFFSDLNFSVVALQHLLTLFSCGLFIFVFYRLYGGRKFIPLLTAAALAAYATSGVHLVGDSTLMSDSLFANLVLLSLAGLVAGIGCRRGLPLCFGSLAMAAAIMVQPAGLFFLAPFLVVPAFLLRNRLPRRTILSFVLPLPAILAALSLYNRLNIGTFALSTFSEHALISFSSTFLETDATLGPRAAEAAERCRQAVGKKLLNNAGRSWDFNEIRDIWNYYYENSRMIVAALFSSASRPTLMTSI
jgi:hypothetical protein